MNVAQGCNLGCSYCFAGDGSYGEKGVMTDSVAKKSIDWLFRNTQDDEVEINFFGGEPLINFRTIKSATHYAQHKAKRLGKFVKYGLTSNGTLINSAVAQFFAENNFSVAISIDGDEEMHNRNRPTKSGKSSFEAAINGIRVLKQHGVRVVARVTLIGSQNDIAQARSFIETTGADEIHVALASPPTRYDSGKMYSVIEKQCDQYSNPDLLDQMKKKRQIGEKQISGSERKGYRHGQVSDGGGDSPSLT